MQKIRLICIDEATYAALQRGVTAFESKYGVGIGEHAALTRDIVVQTLNLAKARPREAAFGGYLVVDPALHVVIGTGGFRDGPSSDGSVELAYSTFPSFEGQGYATETARELIRIASAHPNVRRIIAHTLATPGPSPRILEKVGMRHLGEVIDPEDGPVWEFEIAPQRTESATYQSAVDARAIAVLMSIYLVLGIAIFGMRRDDYSHFKNTISELGEFGGADSRFVSYGLFLPVGLAFVALSTLFWRARPTWTGRRATAALLACVAAGYLVASFFPCDPGSPLTGSTRQAIHNWGGAIEYFGGATALFFLARASKRYRWLFIAGGVTTLVVAFALSTPDLATVRGLLQRVAEAFLFGTIILAAGLNYPEKPQHG